MFGAFHEIEESLILQSHVRIKGKKADKSHAKKQKHLVEENYLIDKDNSNDAVPTSTKIPFSTVEAWEFKNVVKTMKMQIKIIKYRNI